MQLSLRPASLLSSLALGALLAACGSEAATKPAAIAKGVTGTTCEQDATCGAGSRCLTDLPGGYCTATCGPTTECPSDAVCASLSNGSSAGPFCAVTCLRDEDCRDGYHCEALSSGTSVCNADAVAAPTEDTGSSDDTTGGADAGIDTTPADTTPVEPLDPNIGAACDSAAVCGAPTPAEPLCLLPPQGFPGGSCSAACADAADCGEGAACLSTSVGGRCVATCAPGETCREGYECCTVAGVGNCLPVGLVAGCQAPVEQQGPPPGGISATCAGDSDCTEGTDPLCFQQFGESLCTSSCADDADCGTDGVCGDVGGGQTFCFRLCEQDSDCREDHVCCDVGGAAVCLSTTFCQ